MLATIASAVVNHLLQREPWARERLQPFTGQVAAVTIAPLGTLAWRIRDDGMLAPAAGGEVATLSATVPASALPRFVSDREALMAELHIAGAADFAAAVQFVARHLRWDAEEDLSHLVGDIPARRIAAAGRGVAAWQRDAGTRLAANIKEYVTEEAPLVARIADVSALARGIDDTTAALARLDARIARLEQSIRRVDA